MYQRIQTELLITRVQAVSQTCRDAMWFPSWQLDNSPLLTLSSIWGCKIVNLHHCITVSQYIFRLLVSDGWPASTGLFKGCGLKATAETEWNNMTDISQKNSCDPQRGCWCLKKGSRFDAKQSSFIAWTQVLCAKPGYAHIWGHPPGVHIPRRSAFEIPFMTGWPFPMSCLMQRTRTLEQRWETLCRGLHLFSSCSKQDD